MITQALSVLLAVSLVLPLVGSLPAMEPLTPHDNTLLPDREMPSAEPPAVLLDPGSGPTSTGTWGPALAVAAGQFHSCAVTRTGRVKCWGSGDWGQLGNGVGVSSPVPVDVVGLTGRALAVTPGWMHTCALLEDGRVMCWGAGNFGQLGDGTGRTRFTPVEVVGLPDRVIAISGRLQFNCALTQGGAVFCWGRNHYGQLGDGTSTDRIRPVQVIGLPAGVTAIATGQLHACALTEGGAVWCWGGSNSGQAGAFKWSVMPPAIVNGLGSGVAAISTGENHNCTLMQSGGVKCWGYNGSGQLGDGTRRSSANPVDVSGVTVGVARLAAGGWHTCVIMDAAHGGAVRCWAWRSDVPVDIPGLANRAVAISGGEYHYCAVMGSPQSGALKCWGQNMTGQLGNGTFTQWDEPVDVVGFWGPHSAAGRVVTDAGWPLEGVTITSDAGHSATTGADGAYVLAGLMPGTYDLFATHRCCVFAPGSQSVAVPPDGTEQDFTATLVPPPTPTPLPPGAVSGRVYHDLDGNGVREAVEPGLAGVQVCAAALGHRPSRCAMTDVDGGYTIAVEPGSYLVAPSDAPAGLQATTPGFHLPITVAPGQVVQDADFGYR